MHQPLLHQLAQVNVARLKYPIDDPRVAGFVKNIERVNAVADRSEGFVWRLQDDENHALDVVFENDNPMLIVNMSVWETPEHLEKFVWQTVHKQVYKKKNEWFEALGKMHLALWWVKVGHQPGIEEARDRLKHLNEYGSSDTAFGWDYLSNVKLWQKERCA
jgi:hypothetical protein